ncbi:MAG: HAD family hydrolase [Promethearchaeia archaeon]
MTFNYYIFDLDNCILRLPNSSHYFNNILIDCLKLLDSEIIPDTSQRANFWSAGQDYHLVLREWGVNDPEKFWNTFDKIDFTIRKKLISEEKISLYADVIPVLKKLTRNNKKICMVSNTSEEVIEHIFEEFNLGRYFHKTFGMGADKDESLAKPSPEGIKKVLEEVNYEFNDLQDAIMIGDSHVDIFAAKQANIHACLIRREKDKYPDGFKNWRYKPDSVIFDLNEIFTL